MANSGHRIFRAYLTVLATGWDKGPVVVKVRAPSLHDDLQQIIAVQGRLLLLTLAVLLLSARGFVAGTCIIGSGFLLYCIASYASLGTKVFTAYAVTWFLLISGVVMVLRHWRTGKDRGAIERDNAPAYGVVAPALAYRIDCRTAHGR